MKLYEVLESGKKFRRKKWSKDQYYYIENDEVFSNHNYEQAFDLAQVLADDWEIFEEKIELTESQIREAFENVCTPELNIGQRDNIINGLTQNLGF